MIVTPTTLFSQRAEPAPLWLSASLKRCIRRGTTRISRVLCGKRSEAGPRVSPFPGLTARRTGGVLVVRATPMFWPLVRHGGAQRGTGVRTPFDSPFWGRSHHSDPWREGRGGQPGPSAFHMSRAGVGACRLSRFAAGVELSLGDLDHTVNPVRLDSDLFRVVEVERWRDFHVRVWARWWTTMRATDWSICGGIMAHLRITASNMSDFLSRRSQETDSTLELLWRYLYCFCSWV